MNFMAGLVRVLVRISPFSLPLLRVRVRPFLCRFKLVPGTWNWLDNYWFQKIRAQRSHKTQLQSTCEWVWVSVSVRVNGNANIKVEKRKWEMVAEATRRRKENEDPKWVVTIWAICGQFVLATFVCEMFPKVKVRRTNKEADTINNSHNNLENIS